MVLLASPQAHFDTGPEYARRLSSDNWTEVHSAAEEIFNRMFHAMPDDERPDSFHGLSCGEVKALYKEQKTNSNTAESQLVLRQGLEDLTKQQIAAISHVENVRGILRMNSHVMADRNHDNLSHGSHTFDRDKRRADMIKNLQTRLKHGDTVDSIKFSYSNTKVWLTNTAHPTKDKNDEGEKYSRGSTKIAEESVPEEREDDLARNIHAMLRTPLAPEGKDSYTQEIKDGLRDSDIYANGMLDWLEDQQYALDHVFGPGVIDLSAEEVHIDVALRDWRTGDADGNEVPAATLFSKRLRSIHAAIGEYISILEGEESLKHVLDVYKTFQQNVEPIYARVQEFEAMGFQYPRDIDFESNKQAMREKFEEAKQQLTNAFRGIEFNGETYESGAALTQAMMDDLKSRDLDGDAELAARRAIMRHKQLGLAMQRQEVRHNGGGDIEEIFEKLYQHLKTKEGVELPQKDKLSDLQPHAQAKFFKRLMGKHSEEMKDWLIEANPDGWHREIIERFGVIESSYNQNRLGANISAEATPTSMVKQQVLAEAFGIKGMVHVALNEDETAIKDAAKNLALYSKEFGRKNLEIRAQRIKTGENTPDVFFCVMDPQSDSHKNRGMFMKPRQRYTGRDLLKMSIDKTVAAFGKLGTGGSYARGGFSPKMAPRMIMHLIMSLKDVPESARSVLKQCASYTSLTIQGRMVGTMMGTSAQVYDLLDGIVSEQHAAHMAIDKKIDPELVAPKPVKYTTGMRAVLDRLEQEARDKYFEMRTLQSAPSMKHTGELRVDRYAEEASAMAMAEKAGTGARKAGRNIAKLKGLIAKPLSSLRAIGTNIANVNTDSFYDGSYMMGYVLSGLHKAYQEGEITRQDLVDYKNDKFYWQHAFPNAVAALGSADYQSAFDRLTKGERSVNVADLKNAIANDYKGMRENEAFHAVLAIDAMQATSYLEALLEVEPPPRRIGKLFNKLRFKPLPKTGFDKSPDEIMAMYDDSDKLRTMSFGSRTYEAFADLEDVEALREDSRLSRAIQHEMERRIRLPETDPQHISLSDPEDEKMLFQIAGSHRALATPVGTEYLLDHTGFGSDPVPVYERIRNAELHAQRRLQALVEHSNDNDIFGCS